MSSEDCWSEILGSMSAEDRRLAVLDEFQYGVVYAEDTGDGYRRIDPLEVEKHND